MRPVSNPMQEALEQLKNIKPAKPILEYLFIPESVWNKCDEDEKAFFIAESVTYGLKIQLTMRCTAHD